MKFWYQNTIKSKRFLNENAVISGVGGEVAAPLVQPKKPFMVIIKYGVDRAISKNSTKG